MNPLRKRKKAPKQHSRPSHKAEKREEPAAEEKEPVKDRQPKPVKEKTFKEKPVREPKEKVQKEKPVKQSREIEVLSDPEEIKEIEERRVCEHHVCLQFPITGNYNYITRITRHYRTNFFYLRIAFLYLIRNGAPVAIQFSFPTR